MACNHFGVEVITQACLLHLKCRSRISLADRRASTQEDVEASLATAQHIAHRLMTVTDTALVKIGRVALGIVPWLSSSLDDNFSEVFDVQLHGDIRFRDHVEAVVVEASQATNESVLRSLGLFSSRYDVPIIWLAGLGAQDFPPLPPSPSLLGQLVREVLQVHPTFHSRCCFLWSRHAMFQH